MTQYNVSAAAAKRISVKLLKGNDLAGKRLDDVYGLLQGEDIHIGYFTLTQLHQQWRDAGYDGLAGWLGAQGLQEANSLRSKLEALQSAIGDVVIAALEDEPTRNTVREQLGIGEDA